jgi:hypothetical protein
MILTINLPLGGPTAGLVGEGALVDDTAGFKALPVDVVPRGVAGGVSFDPHNSETTSALLPSFYCDSADGIKQKRIT